MNMIVTKSNINEIRVLSVRQPYASLLAVGLKRFETRGWNTDYRGLLVIHASKACSVRDVERVRELSKAVAPPPMTENQQRLAFDTQIVDTLGCAIGIVEMSGCRQMMDGGNDWENSVGFFGDGRYGFECRAIEVFRTPVPAIGRLGLWKPEAGLIDAVKSCLGM